MRTNANLRMNTNLRITTNGKKRILIFSVAYLPFVGGAEVAVKKLTDHLGDYDFDLVTVNLDGKQKTSETIGRVNVYRVGRGTVGKYLFPISGFLKARQLHKENSYDLTWAIMASYAGLAGLFFKKRFSKIPLVLTLQEGDPLPYVKKRMGVLLPLFKSLFKNADKITAISNYLADWGREMGARVPVEVIPNGVDIFWFDPKQTPISSTRESFWRAKRKNFDAKVVLITTSRLVHKNAIDMVIRSLVELPTDVHFVILGDGPKRSELKALAEHLALSDRVHFEGFIKNSSIIHYLRHSDIFIRPSRSEGMGNSFIEAMAAGLPVIATPVGGIVDFLKDGETGLFCEVDNPKSIAQKMEKLMKDVESRDYIVANASKMVAEKYDWSLIAEKMRKVLGD